MGILGPLALGLVAKGGMSLLGAHQRANQLNQYDDMLNQNLKAAGAQPLDFGGHKNFSWQNGVGTMHKQYADDALKRFQEQQQLGDINSRLPQGAQPFVSLPAAEAYNTGVSQPLQKNTYEREQNIQNAQPLRDLIGQSPSAFFPGSGWETQPGGGMSGVMIGNDGRPLLNLAAGKVGGLSSLDGMTEKEIYDFINANRATSGENRAINADERATAKEGREASLFPVKQQQERLKIRKQELDMRKTQQDIANIQQIMKYRPREAEARIRKLAQKTGAQPNAISIMLQSGKTPKQIGDALFNKVQAEGMGLDFGEPSGGGAPAPGGVPSFNDWRNGKR